MMIYCPNCGSKNADEAKFCISCGYDITPANFDARTYTTSSLRSQVQNQEKTIVKAGAYSQMEHFADFPETRNSALWILGMFFVPFLPFIYIYLNFDDMRKLMRIWHPQEVQRVQEPLTMTILYFILSPVAIYYKYENLHRHLVESHREYTRVISGAKMLGLIIGFPVFFTFAIILIVVSGVFVVELVIALIIISAAFSLYMLYLTYVWQEELNSHIIRHKSSIKG